MTTIKKYVKATVFVALLVFAQNLFAQSAQSLYYEGITAEDERSWWIASEKFQAAVRKNPAYTDAWYHLAFCVYQMDSFDLAMTYIQNAKKYSPGRTDILNLEGMINISLGRFDDATKIFNQVQASYPNDIDSRFGLAELNLISGRTKVAQGYYLDALGKNPGNLKAILSLALLSSDTGNEKEAERYINMAMNLGEPNYQVYYIAAYLDFKKGKFAAAEKRCLASMQLDANYEPAYELLSSIYFAQERYADVIDLADFGISRDRNNKRPWYIKGLSLQKLGRIEEALATWLLGLEAIPEDEVMRAAFELQALKTYDIEDRRRAEWAKYHLQKAQDYAKKYSGRAMRYEYQAALRLNPLDYGARKALSNLMRSEGFSENYLSQIKFIQENEALQNRIQSLKDHGIKVSADDEKNALTRLSDTVEGYESLLENTLASKWNINPFYVDKTRWNIGFYYMKSKEPLVHPELSRIAAEHLAILFRDVLGRTVNLVSLPANNFTMAYSDAYKKGYDYFIMLDAEENERDLKFKASMYSAKTGTEAKSFSTFKTGNDNYASALLALRADILSVLPVRAKILNRSGNDILVDIGRTEGMVKDAKFAVIKRGALRTADTGVGLYYSDNDFLGIVTLTNVSEEISEGVLSDTGFYDRVNPRDELVLIEFPNKSGNAIAQDNAPAANKKGAPVLTAAPSQGQKSDAFRGAKSVSMQTSTLIDMIRRIH